LKRRKKQPKALDTPFDAFGLKTPAARHMVVVEDAAWTNPETGKKENPNGVKRARRVSWAEVYRNKGKLTARQYNAATMLQGAWERTQRSQPAIRKVKVDSTTKPDAARAIQADRLSKFHAIYRHVPLSAKPVIDHVVIDNRPAGQMAGARGRSLGRHMARLSEGLEKVADALGL
jgi:hypothetical protein